MEQKKKEQFSRLIQENKRVMYRIAYRILWDAEDAEDAVGDAIVKAYENVKFLWEEEKFRARLIRIVINVSKNIKKKRKRELRGKAEEYIQDNAHWDDYNEWQDIIDKMSSKIGMVVQLYYCENYSVEDICQILGIPSGTVKSRLSKGRSILKEEFLDEKEE